MQINPRLSVKRALTLSRWSGLLPKISEPERAPLCILVFSFQNILGKIMDKLCSSFQSNCLYHSRIIPGTDDPKLLRPLFSSSITKKILAHFFPGILIVFSDHTKSRFTIYIYRESPRLNGFLFEKWELKPSPGSKRPRMHLCDFCWLNLCRYWML